MALPADTAGDTELARSGRASRARARHHLRVAVPHTTDKDMGWCS
jgi:hypothetical protein